MTDDYDLVWMTEQTGQLVLAAIDRDSERAATIVCEIGERYGWRGGYGMCNALAQVIATLGDYEKPTGGFYGFTVEHIDRGVISAAEVDDNARDVTLAMQFFVAYMNRDVDQMMALFGAAETPEEAVKLPVGLVALVGAYGRHKLRGAS